MKAKKHVGFVAVATALAIAAAMMGGCSNAVEKQGAENNLEAYGKFDPPIKVKMVKALTTERFENGDTIDNNVWTRAFLDDLGIELEYMWTVPETQYEEKMNLTVASGELPDIFNISAKQFKQLVQAGKVQQLDEVLEKTANDHVKNILNLNDAILKSATIDGKIMGLAGVSSKYDASDLIWIRTDWLNKLGLNPPKTMQELNEILLAFTKNDPDGNGVNDTYGLAICKALIGGRGGIQGYAAGYHAYMDCWYPNENDELVYGSTQPEMREALLALQNLMKQGAIDPEFGVKDADKVDENIGAGKIGVSIGAMWQPNLALGTTTNLNPEADWLPYGLVSIDDKPACTMVDTAPANYMVVNSKFAYPEAFIKMLNMYTDRYLFADTMELSEKYVNTPSGIEAFKYIPVGLSYGTKNINFTRNAMKARETGDTSVLLPGELKSYERIKAYEEGNKSNWSTYRIFGPSGAFDVIDNEYAADNRILENAFYDVPTETMAAKMSTLNAMELEVFTKIILGEDISLFDSFVKDWNEMGGSKITDEVNQWYKAIK